MNQKHHMIEDPVELCRILNLPETRAVTVGIKLDLFVSIRKRIEKRGWTHAQAAEKAGVGRTVITGIMGGHITKVSVEKLIEIASSLGLKVKLKVA